MAHFSYISELDSMDMYFIDFYNEPFILNLDCIGLSSTKERCSVKYICMDEIKTRTGYFYIYSEVIIVDLLGLYGESSKNNITVVYDL